ncbi:hypothetical protein V1264_013096 [Littorina saxatilis]|uniref:Phosphatidylcholine transfer protein n=1 Tax=Littorina saxatilis TaxID=31220 RepID=A0AAN9BPP9_9CAEN
MLLSAAGIFQWERDGVADKELQSALSEMEEMERLVEHASKSKAKHAAAPEGWELVIDRQHLKVWRRFMEDYNLFEYRVFGSFKDITPMAFYNVQMDLKFWCGWDPQTMEINVVDTDPKSSSEIIHWVYKYPYPMLPRDYCYVRRSTVNDQKNRIVIRAKAVPHHKCPEVNNIVRVHQYQSQLVIEPVSSFSEVIHQYQSQLVIEPVSSFGEVIHQYQSQLVIEPVSSFSEVIHQYQSQLVIEPVSSFSEVIHRYQSQLVIEPVSSFSEVIHQYQSQLVIEPVSSFSEVIHQYQSQLVIEPVSSFSEVIHQYQSQLVIEPVSSFSEVIHQYQSQLVIEPVSSFSEVIHQYQSQLVIEPVSSFSENGFSFYMTYFDNPQTQLPSMCYNWLASTGVPDFVDRLHKASKVMQERTNRGYRPNILVSSHSSEQKESSRLQDNMQQKQPQSYC